MRHLLLAASVMLAAAPALAPSAMAQQAQLNTSVTEGARGPSVTIPSNTAAPVPSVPPPSNAGDGAPSMIPEIDSPAGGDAPSGPTKATPYSAGPSGSDTVPTVGGLPDNPGYGGVVPGDDPTTSK